MREIIEIVGIESKVSAKGVPFTRTHAILNDGEEATGFGSGFKVGDKVQVFFQGNMIKMQKQNIPKGTKLS